MDLMTVLMGRVFSPGGLEIKRELLLVRLSSAQQAALPIACGNRGNGCARVDLF
jgi:Na+/H+ antiporter NhaA